MPIEGMDEFKRKFEQVIPQLLHGRIKEAMAKAADQLVSDMKARAPVYQGPQTMRGRSKNRPPTPVIPGALRDSIRWVWGDAPKDTINIASAGDKTTGLRISVIAGGKGPWGDAFYARWVEHGTVKWRGSPFFFFTYRDHRRRIRSAITRAVRKAIKEANGL